MQTIQELVAKGKIVEAIELLDDTNFASVLSARYAENERRNRIGTISHDDYTRERAKILEAILPNEETERVAMARSQIRAIGNLPAPTRNDLNRMVRLANGIGYNTYEWVYRTDVYLPENVIFAIADDIMNWL